MDNSKGPRICLLTGSFYPVVGGGETHARLLCREILRQGGAVFVVTRRRVATTPAFERVDGISVYRVPPSGVPRLGKYLMMAPALLRMVRMRREYDLVYVCGLRILGIVGVLAALACGKKVVLRSESRGELSGAFIWQKTDGRTSPGLKAAFALPIAARNHILRRADAFLSIAGVIREEYEACGVPARKLLAIPNGIDTDTFVPARPEERRALRARLGLPEGRLYAYSGKLNRGKGLEFLVRVWKDWCRANPGCVLVLVGGGAMQFLSCERELRDYVAAHDLGVAVRFTGYVTHVQDYLRAADYFVFPSESEALPLALLEAMACGLPALASDIGGVRDIVEDGRNGRLAPPNDAAAWTRLLDETVRRPEETRALGEAGRATVLDKFGIRSVAEAHLRAFARLS
jgi:glycosyltransferase involved in cell wall biosynthesis